MRAGNYGTARPRHPASALAWRTLVRPLLAMPADAPPPYTYHSISQDEEAQLADSDAFKVDVTVEQSDPEVRALFVRKVYSVLFLQLLGTAAVAGAMSTSGAVAWVQQKYATHTHAARGSCLCRSSARSPRSGRCTGRASRTPRTSCSSRCSH